MSGNTLLERIDAYVQTIREHHPLTTDEVKKLDAYFRIGMAYTLSTPEGNSLTLSETRVLLEDGIAVGGKPIRDCYETTNHARAYDYMLGTAKDGPLQFREEDMLRLYALLYGGTDPERARYHQEGQVFIIGTEYVPPMTKKVPGLVAGLVEELSKRRDAMHPILLAACTHRRLVDIRSFQDGNGCTARLLMNPIPMNRGYCVVSILPILRHDYIIALQQAQRARGPSNTAFIRLTCGCELEAQRDYYRMFRIELPERRKDTPKR